MSKIRESLMSNSEKHFLTKLLSDNERFDGRKHSEYRPVTINFGKDWGCCNVSLGNTIVLAQTTCEVQAPKSSRPSEGILYINLELNPIAAPHFEVARISELGVQLNRILEKCFKDSKAIDLESLCIKTNEKIWALRVDLNILNHDGNILDCACIAVLTSLAHFKRPDVTCDGKDFIIHSYQQRDPIPIVIHHYPVTVSFAIFEEKLIVDPRLQEEGVADASLIVCLNGAKEICGLHLGGHAELAKSFILSAVMKATSRVSRIIDQIKNSIKIDHELREKKTSSSYHSIKNKMDETIVEVDDDDSIENISVQSDDVVIIQDSKGDCIKILSDTEDDDIIVVESKI